MSRQIFQVPDIHRGARGRESHIAPGHADGVRSIAPDAATGRGSTCCRCHCRMQARSAQARPALARRSSSGSGAARQPWKTVRPAVPSCTVQVPAERVGRPPYARLRLTLARGGGPLAQRVSSGPGWGLGHWHCFNVDRPEAQQQRDAVWVERGPDPAPQPVVHDPHRRPFRRPSVGESRLHCEAPSDAAGSEVVAVAARTVAATGGAVDRVRTPTPDVSCSRQTRDDPDGMERSKLWLRGPDRPLRGRPGPCRQGQVLARARASTGVRPPGR